MNGIKNKLVNKRPLISLSVKNIVFGVLSMGTIFFLNSCAGTQDVEKETWLLPCNYKGFATIYFDVGTVKSNDPIRREYAIDNSGVGFTPFGKNDGFSQNLNETMIIKMKCDTGVVLVPYFENSVVDTVSNKIFATNLIVGKKNNRFFKSIFIVNKSRI